MQKYFYTYINDGNHNIFYNDLRLLHNRYIKLKSFETEKAIEKNSIIKFTFAILNPRENFQKIKYLSISIYILPFLQRKMSYQGSNWSNWRKCWKIPLCNCRIKQECQSEGKCQIRNMTYKCAVIKVNSDSA